MPNPFYQIYEGAALLAGAEPVFLNTTAGNRFQPDLDAVPAEIWKRCQVLFLCSPGNPTGAVLSLEFLRHALELAEQARLRHRLRRVLRGAVSRRERAAALAAAGGAAPTATTRFERCMVFHSLSKRSSVPGLRSGFVAGDPALIKPYPAVSHLSRLRHAGADAARQHRRLERRRARRRQPRAVSREISRACCRFSRRCSTWWSRTARFYLWPDVQRDDETFTRELFATQNLTILPGSYLARDTRARQSRPAARAHLAGRAGGRMCRPPRSASELSWRTT